MVFNVLDWYFFDVLLVLVLYFEGMVLIDDGGVFWIVIFFDFMVEEFIFFNWEVGWLKD